jgi:hypothetical protein
MKKYLSILTLIGLFCGCSMKEQWNTDLTKDVTEMEQAGWSYFETLGTPGKWDFKTGADAPTAKTIGADWSSNGVPKHKVYSQDGYVFAIHVYIKSNGDSFVEVFRRQKARVNETTQKKGIWCVSPWQGAIPL